MRVLIDTQVVVHAYIGDVPLSRKVYALLSSPEALPLISAVSIMEIAMKHEAGKLKMGAAETRQAIRDLRLQVIPFSPEHALSSVWFATPSPRSLRSNVDRDCVGRRYSTHCVGSSVQEVQGIESDLEMIFFRAARGDTGSAAM